MKNGWYGVIDDAITCVTDNSQNENVHTSTHITQNYQIQCIADSEDTHINQSYYQAMNNFNDIIEKMKGPFDSNKQYFLPSITSFVNSIQNNERTHASLSSEMQTFGKYSKILGFFKSKLRETKTDG